MRQLVYRLIVIAGEGSHHSQKLSIINLICKEFTDLVVNETMGTGYLTKKNQYF
jgi:hypothetical protein